MEPLILEVIHRSSIYLEVDRVLYTPCEDDLKRIKAYTTLCEEDPDIVSIKTDCRGDCILQERVSEIMEDEDEEVYEEVDINIDDVMLVISSTGTYIECKHDSGDIFETETFKNITING